VAYPLAVYWAHTRLETRALGVTLLALLGLGVLVRLRGHFEALRGVLAQHAGIVVLVVLAIALDERALLLVLPAAVSLYLLATFGASLRSGPPMIERFARIIEDDLPDFTLPYCRAVTIVWCGFFCVNAIAVCLLAFVAPLGWWAIYNGLIFYALLGGLMGVEFVLRKLRFRYYGDGAIDRFMARLFPAERTARGRRSLAYVAARISAQEAGVASESD
jgi:uncharacterized membrane protein